MTEPLTPEDAAVLRMLAGANFLGGNLTLPSGRTLTPDEAQALTSAYAPAAGEADEAARHINEMAEHVADLSADLAADMAGRMPRDGESLEAHWLAVGGDPGNERTRAILREADRGRMRQPVQETPSADDAATPDEPKRRRWFRR